MALARAPGGHTHSQAPCPLHEPLALVAWPRSAVGCRAQDLLGSPAGAGLLLGMKDTEEAKGQSENLKV